MPVLPDEELARLVTEFRPFIRPYTALAVILAESNGDSTAVNTNTNGSRDRGLWQINDRTYPTVTDQQAFSPEASTVWAYNASSQGTNFSLWRSARDRTPAGNYIATFAAARLRAGIILSGGEPPQDNADIRTPQQIRDEESLIPTPIRDTFNTITDFGRSTLDIARDTLRLVERALRVITSADFWVRALYAVVGSALIIFAVYFIFRRPLAATAGTVIAESVENSAALAAAEARDAAARAARSARRAARTAPRRATSSAQNRGREARGFAQRIRDRFRRPERVAPDEVTNPPRTETDSDTTREDTIFETTAEDVTPPRANQTGPFTAGPATETTATDTTTPTQPSRQRRSRREITRGRRAIGTGRRPVETLPPPNRRQSRGPIAAGPSPDDPANLQAQGTNSAYIAQILSREEFEVYASVPGAQRGAWTRALTSSNPSRRLRARNNIRRLIGTPEDELRFFQSTPQELLERQRQRRRETNESIRNEAFSRVRAIVEAGDFRVSPRSENFRREYDREIRRLIRQIRAERRR